tara:strand:+ start:1436 stop:1774 length:339 start_codon:yes stop_codon:yes gene_type:complete
MRKTIIFLFTALLSVSILAEHHKGNGKDRPKGDLFKQADADKDGRVSYDEHEIMIARMADKGREHFNRMDADSDGFVTKDEAKAMRGKMKKRHKMKRKKRKALMEEKSDSDE